MKLRALHVTHGATVAATATATRCNSCSRVKKLHTGRVAIDGNATRLFNGPRTQCEAAANVVVVATLLFFSH